MKLSFTEQPAFSSIRDDLFGKETSNGSFPRLQSMLMDNPRAGDVIPGSGGARKVRWTLAGQTGGKRGGIRVIYFYNEERAHIWLLRAYAKNTQENMIPRQIQDTAEIIRQERGPGE